MKILTVSKNIFRRFSNITPVVNTWNEWDPLEEVVVGNPDNAVVPPLEIETKPCIIDERWSFFQKNGGKLWSEAAGSKFWKNVLEEHQSFVDTLIGEGIKVIQPEAQCFTDKYSILNHKTTGMYCAMPRDILLSIGNEIIEAPMTWRSRYFEINSYKTLLQNYWRNGASWVAAPKPTYRNLFENVEDPKSRGFVTNESEPTFDAADFLKAGTDMFAQRSHVTNELGIHWVRSHLKDKGIRVIKLSFDDSKPMHIDASLMPLKPGIILCNPDRKCHQIQHFIDAGWKIVHAVPRLNSGDHPYYLTSLWITMNILMLDENTVVVEAEDFDLQKFFKNLNFKVITVKFRHCNSIGGGFHCWTADIRRRGDLKSYFDWKPDFYEAYLKDCAAISK